MHESLQLHPTHKHILGSECSASLQQPTPRKFFSNPKSKSSQNPSSAHMTSERKITFLPSKSMEYNLHQSSSLTLKISYSQFKDKNKLPPYRVSIWTSSPLHQTIHSGTYECMIYFNSIQLTRISFKPNTLFPRNNPHQEIIHTPNKDRTHRRKPSSAINDHMS